MFKKQIRRTEIRHRSLPCCIHGLMLMGSMTAFAGNTADTSYNVNVGPGGFTTVSRSKQNDSSLYISHQGDRGVNVGVFSGGVNYSANGGYYYVAAGTSAYLPSYVNESGKSSCYLHLIPSPASSCHLYGRWRPDSK